MNGKLDWTLGAFYMEHEIENHIRGYRDNDLDGELQYVCGEPFARADYCFTVGGPAPWFFFEFDFVSDAFPTRESFSYMEKLHIVFQMSFAFLLVFVIQMMK